MSFKIKALLLVVICSRGVRNEPRGGAGDAAAEDTALLTRFLTTIDSATDEEVLINVTTTILNNLCACIRDTLDARELIVVHKNVNNLGPVPEEIAGEDRGHYEAIYDNTCRDLPLQQSDLPSPQTEGYKKKCSRFDFVRKYEEAIMDNQLKSKFKKIMYNILIRSKDRHKYEIKKYNLYEKPQTFERNAMRSVIVIITLNFSKSFKAKPEPNAVKLSEIDAALEDRGDVYVDFIDPAYDPKHTKISSAKNVSYCNLKSVLTVLLESEKNNLTKTFKLIRKGGTIKVYTSLSTNYAYERYSDICCYKNTTNTFCETTMKDVDPGESKLYKGERTERITKYKETVSKIKALIQIYNKKLKRVPAKAETVRTDKVDIINSSNRYHSNLLTEHKNRSTYISDQHFTYHYKKFMSSKLNNLSKTEDKITRNNSFLATNRTAIDSQFNSQITTDLIDVTNNEVSNTVEAEKIYLKVCNYGMWSNTTMKEFSPYNYVISNKEPQITTYSPVPLQMPTEPKVKGDHLPVQPAATYPSNYIGSTRQNTYDEGKFERNETGLKENLPSDKNDKGMTNMVTYNRTTNTLTSQVLTTTTKFDERFTKMYTSRGSNHSILKSIQRTSPLDVLNEVNYVSLMMNSLTSSNVNINKITKRWTTPNVTDITLPDSKALSLLDSHRGTTAYPSFLSTLNPNNQNQSLKMYSTRSSNIDSTPYNNITKSEWSTSTTKAATSTKNDVRNRTLTLIKEPQLPTRYVEEIDGKRITSPNTMIQSQESKTTPLNDYLLPASSLRSTNKRNTSYIEGTTKFIVNNVKTDIRLDLQTSTELPTRSIYIKKAHERSQSTTEYSHYTSNPLIQNGTSALESVHRFTRKIISPQVPTALYSESIFKTTTTSFFKNYTKIETTTARGLIVNDILNSQPQQLNNKSTLSTQSKGGKYMDSSLTVPKDATTTSHSVQNVTEAAVSLSKPTLLSSLPVASTSNSLKQNKKSDTKSLLKHLSNDVNTFNNQATSLINTSEKYQITTPIIEQTKSTAVHTLRTTYIPTNLAEHKDKVTTSRSVEHLSQALASPQILTFVYSVSVTTSSPSASNNTTTSETKPANKDSANSVKSNNIETKSQMTTSAKYIELKSTTGKTKVKSPMYSSTSRLLDTKKRIDSDVTGTTTQKDKSDVKHKKKYFTKTTLQKIFTLQSLKSRAYYKYEISKLPNNESYDQGESNLNHLSRMTSTTDASDNNYFTTENNINYLLRTGSIKSEKSNSPLIKQQTNTTPLQKGNKISNKYTTKGIVNKTKFIESNISPKHVNNRTSIKKYNTTKNTSSVSDGYTLEYNSIKVPPIQLRPNSKVTLIPVMSPDGQSNDLYLPRDSTFSTSTQKMKSNKKTNSLMLQTRNTIDISALVQTPTVSKLTQAQVFDIVDHTRGYIDLGSRQRLRQGPTFLATKTNNIREYSAYDIPNYKNKTKIGSTVLFPTYFEATQRENRIYDNFFKISQSTNAIAHVKTLFPNESNPKKDIEIRTLDKVNTVKIFKDLISEHISKSTLPLPPRVTIGEHNKKKTFYRTSKATVILSKLQKSAAKAKKKYDVSYKNTTGFKMQTIPFPYKGQNTLSGVFDKTSYTYPISQRVDNSRLPELSKVILTTTPIQNNKTLSIEPLGTKSRALDPPASTSTQARAPVAFLPSTAYTPLISDKNLKMTTKGTPITGYKQSSNLTYHVQRSHPTHTTQINKSNVPTTTNLSKIKHTVETKDKNEAKSVTPIKYSVALSTLTKTITSANFVQVQTFDLSVPTELDSINEAYQDDNMNSSKINTVSAIENPDLNQSRVKNISKAKYSSDFKDIVKSISILQNASRSEQTLAIDSHNTIQYSNDALHSSRLKTKNITTNKSEIKTVSYEVSQVKSTKVSVPLNQTKSILLDTSNNFVTTEYINKINQKNILETLLLTDDNTYRNGPKEIMQTIADHSENVVTDTLSSFSKQNKSFESNVTKVSLANKSHLNGGPFTSPDFTKTTENNVSNIKVRHSAHEDINYFIDVTTQPVHSGEIKAISKNTKFTNDSYTNILSSNSKDKIKEYSTSNNPVKAKTTSEEYGQFQHTKTNETKTSAINVSDGTLSPRTDDGLNIDNKEEIHRAPSEEFGKLFYFKSQVNSTPAVTDYSTESNLHDSARESHFSNVTEWWLDDMYLKVRQPLPIHSNPGMIFPRRRFARLEEVAELAALLLDDLLDYKEMLDRGELPLERATSREKGQPLCMQQFYRLLGVCRLPVAGRDTLHLPPPPPPHLDHQEELVIVACRNYFYPVTVRCTRGRRSPGEIRAQLLHAMVEAAGLPPAPRLGLLTALPRDLWAAARLQLDKEPENRSNLEQISRALCVLCVDEAGGEPEGTDADTAAMLRAMHGAGSQHHSANRWFDKTVQLIVASDGMVGMCYEHSAAEGVAVVRLAERALARAAVAARPAPPAHAAHPTQPLPAPMRWLLTPDLRRLIDRAAEDIDRQIADLDFVVYTYEGYGREFMKACRTSPDVYIQLALQYTYFKLHGRLVSTYESASLRRFRDGRVDNIRSAHAAARAWAQAMCQTPARTEPGPAVDPDPTRKVSFDLHGSATEVEAAAVLSEQRKLQLFEEAARKQTAVMEANILGRGIDNHLLGLREMARAAGAGTLPPLFTDPTYRQMMEFKLSTSQVATTTEGTCMGYGAVVPDGYGCSYNPKKDRVIFCIASFRSSHDTSTAAFRRALHAALDDMRRIFPHH